MKSGKIWLPVFVAAGAIATSAYATDAGDGESPAPELTVVTAAAEIPAAPGPSGAPVLLSVSARKNVRAGINIMDLVPDFRFIAPRGNAIMLRRELVDTSGAFAQTQIQSATINIPAEAQKKGAVISGGWRCGTQVYFVTLRAFLIDSDGNRSNVITYTIHCNGG